MTKLHIIIVLTVFFLCAINKASSLKKFPVRRPYPNPRKWQVTTDTSDHENRVYLACKRLRGYPAQKRHCIIGYHQLIHSTEDRICNVTLKVIQKNDAYIHEDPTIYLFGKDKAVIFWRELGTTSYLRIHILPASGCKTLNTKILAKVSDDFEDDFRFAFGDNTFDVFFKNDTCGGKMCLVTINDQGKIIKGPIGYYEDKYRDIPNYVERIDKNSIEKGHFIIETSLKDNSINYFLRKLDGTEKLLANSLENHWYSPSLANNLIGICFKAADTSQCAQYDFNGKVKLEVIMIQPELIFNLANGGFLFIANHEDECKMDKCHKSYTVTKIDSNGLKFGSFKCFGDSYYQTLYQNKEGKYCFTRPCGREKSDGDSILIQCFDDALFSKEASEITT